MRFREELRNQLLLQRLREQDLESRVRVGKPELTSTCANSRQLPRLHLLRSTLAISGERSSGRTSAAVVDAARKAGHRGCGKHVAQVLTLRLWRIF